MIFWTFALVVSAGILYLLGYITGYNRSTKDQEMDEYLSKLEDEYGQK